MGYTFPDEQTQKFQEYTSINQHYWDQKLVAVERLPVFDDGESESLEDDGHSFVDKTSHLTTAVLRRDVEMNILSQPHLHLWSYVTVLRQCWEVVGMTRTNREV